MIKTAKSVVTGTLAVATIAVATAAVNGWAGDSTSPQPGSTGCGTATLVVADDAGLRNVEIRDVPRELRVCSVTSIPVDGLAASPTISPDGASLAYVSVSDTDTDLVRSALDWSGARPLTATPEVRETGPAWSPDGKRLAFERTDVSGSTEIVVIDVLTGSETQITRNEVVDAGPSWSPDGKSIAFFRRNDGAELYAYDVESGQTRQLTDTAELDESSPVYAADSASLVYVAETSQPGAPDPELSLAAGQSWAGFVRGPDGQSEQVTPLGQYYEPTWSPSQIPLFTYFDDTGAHIVAAPLGDGQDPVVLLDATGFPTFASTDLEADR